VVSILYTYHMHSYANTMQKCCKHNANHKPHPNLNPLILTLTHSYLARHLTYSHSRIWVQCEDKASRHCHRDIIIIIIYNACTFSSGTESEALAVTRWATW